MSRVYKNIVTTKAEDVLVAINCDRCGESVGSIEKVAYDTEFSVFTANWGYYSNKDGLRWNYIFCESCSDDIKKWIEYTSADGVDQSDCVINYV